MEMNAAYRGQWKCKEVTLRMLQLRCKCCMIQSEFTVRALDSGVTREILYSTECCQDGKLGRISLGTQKAAYVEGGNQPN